MKIGIKIYQVSRLEVSWEGGDCGEKSFLSYIWGWDRSLCAMSCRRWQTVCWCLWTWLSASHVLMCEESCEVWHPHRWASQHRGHRAPPPRRPTWRWTSWSCFSFAYHSSSARRKFSRTERWAWYRPFDRTRINVHFDLFMGVRVVCAKFLHSLDLWCFIYGEDMMVVLMAAKTRSMFVSRNRRFKQSDKL